MLTPATLPARVVGNVASRRSSEWLVITTEPGGREVRVRWSLDRVELWRCDDCGAMARTNCSHTFAAALILAEPILGLIPRTESSTVPDVPEVPC